MQPSVELAQMVHAAPPTARQVIALWPTIVAFAAEMGVPAGVARQWKNRDSIPSSHWHALTKAAAARGFHWITIEALADLAERRRAA